MYDPDTLDFLGHKLKVAVFKQALFFRIYIRCLEKVKHAGIKHIHPNGGLMVICRMVESVKNHQTNKSKFMVISWVIFFYGHTHTHTWKDHTVGLFYILHSNCSSRIRSASHQTRQFPVVNPLAEPHLVRLNPLRAIAFFSIAASMIAREQRIKLESNYKAMLVQSNQHMLFPALHHGALP